MNKPTKTTSVGPESRRKWIALGALFVLSSIGAYVWFPRSTEAPAATAKGRVTFQGKPVGGGARVYFHGEPNGPFMTAKLSENGEYDFKMGGKPGLPLSTYKVAVLPPDMHLTAAFIEEHRGQPPTLAKHPNIPLRYRDPNTSGLTVDLKSPLVFDIDMVP